MAVHIINSSLIYFSIVLLLHTFFLVEIYSAVMVSAMRESKEKKPALFII